MSIPTINRAGPTEYQEFCIGQEMRGRSFVMVAIVVVAIALGSLVAYLVVLS